MMGKEQIKGFVRNTLGCTCPEEVFQSIDCSEDVPIQGDITAWYRIDVGGRLLIYVFKETQERDLATDIGTLISHGRQAKESGGYNRFRLVLLSQNPQHVSEMATAAFDSLVKDDKTHLHVVDQSEIPQ